MTMSTRDGRAWIRGDMRGRLRAVERKTRFGVAGRRAIGGRRSVGGRRAAIAGSTRIVRRIRSVRGIIRRRARARRKCEQREGRREEQRGAQCPLRSETFHTGRDRKRRSSSVIADSPYFRAFATSSQDTPLLARTWPRTIHTAKMRPCPNTTRSPPSFSAR
jgi:hypothetical protein